MNFQRRNLATSESWHCGVTMVWCRSVAKFQGLVGQNIFLGGQDFCFYYMFETNFPEHNTICGHKNIWGALPKNAPPLGYGPGLVALPS